MQWKVNGDDTLLHNKTLDLFVPLVHELLTSSSASSSTSGNSNARNAAPSATESREWKLEFNGALMSLPGAWEQLWHADGEHLFPTTNAAAGSTKSVDILPPHCINVFIPLVDVAPGNGGTEFALGSHHFTQYFPSDIVWQRDHWLGDLEKLGYDSWKNMVKIEVQAGQILLFDYRVLHRALAHNDVNKRPLLYYTYTKRWFSDSLNFADLPRLADVETKVAMASA